MSNFETHEEKRDRLAQGQRVEELRTLLANDARDEGFFRAVAMLLVDAILDGDEFTLDAGERELQHAFAVSSDAKDEGRFLGLIDMVAWAAERTVSLSSLAEFEASSHAHEFLKALLDEPGQSNGQLASRLGTSDSEISRVGSRLVAAGAAVKRRMGRRNYWDITPRGIHTVALLEQGGVARHQRPYQAVV